jgi:glutamate N-acetyltransferase/amino-acid N-acetyltransferase
MAVGSITFPEMPPVSGVCWSAVAAHIRKPDRLDLALMTFPGDAVLAGVFTTNVFRAAPVTLAMAQLAAHAERPVCGFLVNTGYANAGTGEAGMAVARQLTAATAAQLGGVEVMPFSTGVIGEALPTGPVLAALPTLVEGLSDGGWADAARAIQTTDTRPKGACERLQLSDGSEIRINGIAKGAGMIRPDMATMLAFVATDARLETRLAERMLMQAVNLSFNRITVDGDTSTNDACMLVATGCHGPLVDDPDSADAQAIQSALTRLCQSLSRQIVMDAEGATRVLDIHVRADNEKDALEVAYTIAHSPLFKTALFAGDPNWGRILAAVGRARLSSPLDLDQVNIRLGKVELIRAGAPAPNYRESLGAEEMGKPEVALFVSITSGTGVDVQVTTSDLSYDYVRINAEYRT